VLESSTISTVAAPAGTSVLKSWLSRVIRRWSARPARQLRLRETLALGERRFLALVEVCGKRFLVGGTSSSLTLLAHLPAGDGNANDRDDAVSAGAEK